MAGYNKRYMVQNFLGIDIGGTKIFAVRMSASGKIEQEYKIPTEAAESQERVLKNIAFAVEKVRTSQTIGIGFSWAGFVDAQKGIVHHAPNISGFSNFALQKWAEKTFHLPIQIENDARLFALAHYKKYNISNLLGIVLGTGVGSGAIVDGHLLRGSQNFAGEVGHMKFSGIEIEDQLSGPALKKFLGRDSLRGEKITLSQIEPVLDIFADWLHSLLFAYNPENIFLGGGVGTHIYTDFLADLGAKLHERIKAHDYPLKCEIVVSDFPDASAVGAAELIQEHLRS